MTGKKLLLLSNSTNYGEPYLGYSSPIILRFLKQKGIRKVLFVPYAAVDFTYDDYENKVKEPLNSELEVTSIHHFSDPVEAIEEAEAVMVGGGNTFRLLERIRHFNLIEPIRKKVEGGMPYVGWSAGSNLACPTIQTTNDMPVVFPGSFEALDLVPFQINAHYTEVTMEGHGGESRDQRLKEYIHLNPDVFVAGLPEGLGIVVDNNHLDTVGDRSKGVKIFKKNSKAVWVEDDLRFLMG